MTTFTVWRFDNPDGASQAESILKNAETDGLVKIIDRVVVSWPADAAKPTTDSGHEDKRRGTGWGAFLGAFVGFLSLFPALGVASGPGKGRAVRRLGGRA